MTEQPTSIPPDEAGTAARQARIAALARGRSTKRRHPAQGARIAAAGIGATTMLGLVGFMGFAAPAAAPAPAPAPVAQPQVVVVVHRAAASDAAGRTVASSTEVAAGTTLTARPTVRPATRRAQAPAASTRGSN